MQQQGIPTISFENILEQESAIPQESSINDPLSDQNALQWPTNATLALAYVQNNMSMNNLQ